MARIERLRLYPVKGFDGRDVDAAAVTAAGTLAGDREFACCDPTAGAIDTAGDVETLAYNGKQSDRFHGVRTAFDPASSTLTAAVDGTERRFDLSTADGRAAAGDWFADFLGMPVDLRRRDPPGFVDRPDAGPSVVGTATLETVADWFEDLTVDGVRRRLRANVEVSGVPAFWEDRFVGDDAPAFVVGDAVRIEGDAPCSRCVVPARDPESGEAHPDFRERFVRSREETVPEWVDRDAFSHWYAVMLIGRVPTSSRGRTIRVGDPVRVVE